MPTLNLSQDDLAHHVVKFGIDIYPPIEIPKERTRLNTFYEEARAGFPQFYEQLIASDTDFRVSKTFPSPGPTPAAGIRVDTFVLTPRGPIFSFPIRLPDPVGFTNLERDMLASFKALKTLFSSRFADQKVMRIGLVRDLLFATGDTSAATILSDRVDFGGAALQGGKRLLAYQDSLCNVRLSCESVELMKTTRLPGTQVTERTSFGLKVELDVNNRELVPLDDAKIDEVIARATSFWPNKLLECF